MQLDGPEDIVGIILVIGVICLYLALPLFMIKLLSIIIGIPIDYTVKHYFAMFAFLLFTWIIPNFIFSKD